VDITAAVIGAGFIGPVHVEGLRRIGIRVKGIAGISPEDQARIFESFERAVPLRSIGGHGLGLWIARRIVQALAGGRRRSPGELAADLDDVPQASLYRHVKRLHEGGVLAVVEERPARGTPERVYALVEGGGSLSPEDSATQSGSA